MTYINRSENPDLQVRQVLTLLTEYKRAHPSALIEARRDGYDFINVRIIDPTFQGMSRFERGVKIWSFLEQLPDETFSDIMSLVLVTPEEAPHNGSSIEFDHPLPPLPIPNFNEGPSATNGHQNSALATWDEMLTVPLEHREAEAVRQLAQSQGLSDGALVQEWVRERLQAS